MIKRKHNWALDSDIVLLPGGRDPELFNEFLEIYTSVEELVTLDGEM